jgi:hypothetical protein
MVLIFLGSGLCFHATTLPHPVGAQQVDDAFQPLPGIALVGTNGAGRNVLRVMGWNTVWRVLLSNWRTSAMHNRNCVLLLSDWNPNGR